MEEGNTSQRFFLIKAGIIVGSGGLIFGYDIGVIAGTLTKLGDVFSLSSYEEGLVVAILYVGSILGSMVGGPMCDYLGRWKTIHIQNILFCIGSFVTGFATNLAMLCIGRFIVGIASAVSGIADVPYLNEISPPQYRGILSSQYEMAVSIGVLVSFAVALALSGWEYGWRVAFLIPSALAILQSCCMVLLPESPRWLLEKGLLDKTRKALSAMYGGNFLTHCSCLERDNDDVPVEVRDYLRACDREGKIVALAAAMENADFESAKEQAAPRSPRAHTAGISAHSTNQGSTTHRHLTKPESADGEASSRNTSNSNSAHNTSSAALRALFLEEKDVLKQFQYPIYLIVVIQILAQVTGGNVIRNYAPTIFENGGVSTTMSLTFNLVFGVIKTIFTFVSIAYIDDTGRLKLLVYGIVLVGTGMLFLAICSLTSPSGNINNVPAFVVGCAMVYAGFGLGYGPVPWVLSAEMFPTLIRGRIMSISLIASNAAQLVVNFLFLPMCEGITTSGTFFFFVALNVLTFVFVKKFFVETKEIVPEQILKALLDRYTHSADKLIVMSPWFFKPFISFCCCTNIDEDSVHAPQRNENNSGTHNHDTEGGEGDTSASAKLVENATRSPSAPLASKHVTYDSTSGTLASKKTANNASMNPLLNPTEGERKNSTSTTVASFSTSQDSNGSGVGQSTSKLTLLSASQASSVLTKHKR